MHKKIEWKIVNGKNGNKNDKNININNKLVERQQVKVQQYVHKNRESGFNYFCVENGSQILLNRRIKCVQSKIVAIAQHAVFVFFTCAAVATAAITMARRRGGGVAGIDGGSSATAASAAAAVTTLFFFLRRHFPSASYLSSIFQIQDNLFLLNFFASFSSSYTFIFHFFFCNRH